MAEIRNYLDSFLSYLRIEKTASKITIRDYRMEILKLSNYLVDQNILDINLISTRILRQYFYYAKRCFSTKPSNFFSLSCSALLVSLSSVVSSAQHITYFTLFLSSSNGILKMDKDLDPPFLSLIHSSESICFFC